ncbi:MAG: DUF4367 domain-containing protein [Actinomycetota bacterium]|nr:DUF4367 domain-containing protein [Actinomycetota bacterium]
MAELERDLRTLGRRLEFPPTPDLGARVRERVEGAPERRWPEWSRRRIAGLALAAALVAALGATFAVPEARTAILRWLGLSGVRIRHVDSLPPTRTEGKLVLLLGERVSLGEARRRAAYRIRVPGKAPRPDAVFLEKTFPGGLVSFVYGRLSKPRLLMMQFQGTSGPYIEKLLYAKTKVENVSVDGAPGYWISGAPHELHFLGRYGEDELVPRRLAGNTLLWERDALTFRLEGRLTKDEAVAIARSVH